MFLGLTLEILIEKGKKRLNCTWARSLSQYGKSGKKATDKPDLNYGGCSSLFVWQTRVFDINHVTEITRITDIIIITEVHPCTYINNITEIILRATDFTLTSKNFLANDIM